MNYIYDILINLQKELYDFYEWNFNDNITHIRKIPLLKISSQDLINIRDNKIKLTEDGLKLIFNKTEIFTSHSVRIIKYLCLFSDGKDVFAVEFDKNGLKIKMSRLLIDEEIEILEVCEHISAKPFDYKIVGERKTDVFKTRKELKTYDYIIKQLRKENCEKLKYLYFECFDKQESDFQKIVLDIRKELEVNWKNVNEKIYNFLKLSSQKQ